MKATITGSEEKMNKKKKPVRVEHDSSAVEKSI